VIRDYANDEASTESTTTLRLHIGGGSPRLGVGTGIHWHMNLENRIDFVAAADGEEAIPYVRLTSASGETREYFAEGVTPAEVAGRPTRRMDCMDCHNRPAHTFSFTPERAIDTAIAQGRIPRELPFVRREAVAAVSAMYDSRDAALEAITRRLTGFYASRGAVDATLVRRAVAVTREVWANNVFPAMNVGWGTYPNHIGHVDTPGCFRCHDDTHRTSAGMVISQDCELCHTAPE
jgi:hypothetical protein